VINFEADVASTGPNIRYDIRWLEVKGLNKLVGLFLSGSTGPL